MIRHTPSINHCFSPFRSVYVRSLTRSTYIPASTGSTTSSSSASLQSFTLSILPQYSLARLPLNEMLTSVVSSRTNSSVSFVAHASHPVVAPTACDLSATDTVSPVSWASPSTSYSKLVCSCRNSLYSLCDADISRI